MKQCSYCGKEYPDDASVCSTDAEPLREVVPKSPIKPKLPKKSDFISLETMLIWAIVIVAVLFILAFFMILLEAGHMHDSM